MLRIAIGNGVNIALQSATEEEGGIALHRQREEAEIRMALGPRVTERGANGCGARKPNLWVHPESIRF